MAAHLPAGGGPAGQGNPMAALGGGADPQKGLEAEKAALELVGVPSPCCTVF